MLEQLFEHSYIFVSKGQPQEIPLRFAVHGLDLSDGS